jgi:hypothetical protein
MHNIMSAVMNLQELREFLKHWAPYKFLWKNNEQSKREMLNASLNEFESWLHRHCELESHLATEPDQHLFDSCLVVSTGKNYTAYNNSHLVQGLDSLKTDIGEFMLDIFNTFWIK